MKNISPFDIKKKQVITLIGEILVDEIYNEEKNETVTLFGGSPANIAINLKDLGIEDVRLFGTIGNDSNGTLVLDRLSQKHISLDNIAVTPYETSVVKLNMTTNTPEATFHRDADYHIEFTSNLEKAIIESSIVHFSYWPLTCEPSKSTIIKVIETAKQHNTLIGFDPNFHKGILKDEILSEYELMKLLQDINITKPSMDDSRRIFGELSPQEVLAKFEEAGCDLVVVSKGKDGLVCMYNHITYIYPSLATKVVDATGAGDAFYSGMYYAILNNMSLNDILYAGSICSAYSLRVIGGVSNLPTYPSLKGKYKR